MKVQRAFIWAAFAVAPVISASQVPDLVAAFDAGGRAMGMGGVTNVTGSDTLSGYYNPAGLGFVTEAQIGGAFRNFPESNTVVTGDIGPTGQQRLSTEGQTGPFGMSHLGIAVPLKNRNGGTNGTIALTVTAGGQMRDSRVSGAGLVEGGLPAGGYTQFIKSDTDFVNLSYGRATGDGSFSWGASLIYAQNRQVNSRFAPSGTTRFDALASGMGAQVGFLITPKENPDFTFGASFRSPIKLHSGGNNPLILEELPGRVSGGIAMRRDGFRQGGRDYMVWGAEVSHFFGGKDSLTIDRNAQTVLGLGMEYNYGMGSSRFPIRLGYSFVPAGGDFFGERNSFTFGFGYRPAKNDWAIDFNFGRPVGGGQDTSIAVSYKIGK